ncbi:MAG: hypothetical protein K6G63_05120 [Eubacterium sp.]|nr:hypothetical protein [Eubacterium sp.]
MTDKRNKAIPYIIANYTTGDARSITKADTYYSVNFASGGVYDMKTGFPSFRGIGCVGNTNKLYNMKLKEVDGYNSTITIDIKLSRYGNDNENYFYGCIDSEKPEVGYSDSINTNGFSGQDGTGQSNICKLSHGIGLFDHITGKNNTEEGRIYFKNINLKGDVKDIVYDISQDTNVNNKSGNYSQRFSAGGVVGMVHHGYIVGFDNITVDDMDVSCPYSCGAIAGLVAYNPETNADFEVIGVKMNRCKTGDIGIAVQGGYNCGNNTQPRQGAGGLLGMVVKSKTTINQELEDGEKDEIYTVKIRYIKNYAPTAGGGNLGDSNSGGIIGYGGTGVVASNISVIGADENAVIGDENATANASGIVAFAQNQSDKGPISTVSLTNCQVSNISINANLNAGGLFAKSWEDGWSPSYCHFIDCGVNGEVDDAGNPKYVIKAYNSSNSTSGGFIASARAASSDANSYSNISGCYIRGYEISANQSGGMAGNVKNKPLHVTDSYIEDCQIASNDVSGGIVSYLEQNVLGYNIKTKNIKFTNDNSGQFIGNANSKLVKLVGVNKYADTDRIDEIKTKDIYSNANASSLIVYADFLEKGNSDIVNSDAAAASSFNATENVKQPRSPFLTVNPRVGMGAGEYITSDSAAGNLEKLTAYADYTSASTSAVRIFDENNSNREYSVLDTSVKSELEEYFKKKNSEDGFKVSTWNTEASAFDGVEDFAVLVIDENNRNKISQFIDNYIKLVTNTNPTGDGYKNNSGSDYQIVIKPCSYDSSEGKFQLGSSGGSIKYTPDAYGKGYEMNEGEEDSTKGNQFTLMDVQFFDPTQSGNKIAYHLYVPVYTRKTMKVNFKAASISGTEYYADKYKNRIESEISSGKNGNENPTIIVESTDTWVTSYIRYEYSKSEVNQLLKMRSLFNWNHDKKFIITRTNESNIPNDTKMVLVDPNNDEDKSYYATAADFELDQSGDNRTVDLSKFKNGDNNFVEQTLSSLLSGKVSAVESENGAYNQVPDGSAGENGIFTIKLKDGTTKSFEHVGSGGQYNLEVSESIYEDYYISFLVPKEDGAANVIRIKPTESFTAIDANGAATSNNIMRATVTSDLNAQLILGDFFEHTIKRFDVTSNDNNDVVISENNNVLHTETEVEIALKNDNNQATFFKNHLNVSADHIYHSFSVLLNRHTLEGELSDVIRGIRDGAYMSECKVYDKNDNLLSSSDNVSVSKENNYIQLTTGDIKSLLLNSDDMKIILKSKSTMRFDDYGEEFPTNTDDTPGVGVQVRIKSNMAYRDDELSYSRMFAQIIESPENSKTSGDFDSYYYTKDQNKARLSFNAVDELDEEDIGSKTFNRSRLGVNTFFTYGNIVHGKSVYNVSEINDVDYSEAKKVRYTIRLYKKTTNGTKTSYTPVSTDIGNYLDNIDLVDSGDGINLSEITSDITGAKVYEGSINHTSSSDDDKVFTAEFECNIKKNSDFVLKDFANYRIMMKAELIGTNANTAQQDYIVYTHAKINPEIIPSQG